MDVKQVPVIVKNFFTKENMLRLYEVNEARVKKNSPQILTTVGVFGIIGTAIHLVDATTKATRILDAQREEKQRKLTVEETVKATWKLYAFPIVELAASLSSVIFAQKISLDRNAALIAAYALSENNFKEYKEKALEVIGEKKEDAVRASIAQDKVDAANIPEPKDPEDGLVQMFDPHSGRAFRAEIADIYRAVDEVNIQLSRSMPQSANDFYDILESYGVRMSDPWIPEYGNRMLNDFGFNYGWSEGTIRKYSNDGSSVLSYRPVSVLDRRGNPVHVIGFNVDPKLGYDEDWL